LPGRGFPRAARLTERYAVAGAVALALIFFVQGLLASRHTSLTWDEPSYISSGYMLLTGRDRSLNPSHPPLMQALEALPLLFLDVRPPTRGIGDLLDSKRPPIELGYNFLFEVGNDPRRLAFWARLPVLLLGSSLVLAVFLWGRSLYGPIPALLATLTAAVSPDLLAHGQLATEDLGCAAFMFFAVWSFWRGMKRQTLGAWSVCGLMTGLALLSKFTAVLLGPIYILLGGGLWLVDRRSAPSRRAVLRAVAVAVSVTAAVVCAGYRTWDLSAYARAMGAIYSDMNPNYHFYLFGTVSERPFWYYALAVFLVKVPVTTTALICIAAIRSVGDTRHREALLVLLVPAAVIIAASFADRYNLGLRRILPAFPFLMLFTAQAAAGLGGRGLLLAAALFGVGALEAVQAYPHHLSFLNRAAGGAERGPYLLDDSNIDWGQDLPALAEWQCAHPEAAPLKLYYFGNAEPAAYGVRAVPFEPGEHLAPRSGYYAVSVHGLVSFRKERHQTGADIDWLAKYRPIARAGYSISIYKFPESAGR